MTERNLEAEIKSLKIIIGIALIYLAKTNPDIYRDFVGSLEKATSVFDDYGDDNVTALRESDPSVKVLLDNFLNKIRSRVG